MDYLDYYSSYLGEPAYKTGSNYQFRCPLCDSSASESHLRVDVNTSVYICFRCGAKGNSSTFARIMGEKPPQGLKGAHVSEEPYDPIIGEEVYTHLLNCMPLSECDLTELEVKRGVINPKQYGLRTLIGASAELTKQFSRDKLLLSGLFYERDGYLVPRSVLGDGRLFIPYIQKERVVYMRTRGLTGPKYLCPKGAKTNQFVWGALQTGKKTVIVTEGEFKAMSAASHGANILAIPGINSAHQVFCDTVKEAGITKVIICFDTQVANMTDVDKAAHKLANQ